MLPDCIRLYWRVRNKLRLVDMVHMLDNSTVVPLKLRRQVLETLHSAHQGCLSVDRYTRCPGVIMGATGV
jgi:hypothetical protein